MEEVWDAIYNSLEWPQWRKGVREVTEIKKNDANGVNGIRKYAWKSFLPYELVFTMRLIEKEHLKHLKGNRRAIYIGFNAHDGSNIRGSKCI